MQINLTKKLAKAIGVKPESASSEIDPVFCWTANWTNTFNRRKEDMVVMVNNATCFTVLIFGVKWNQFKNITEKMTAAIRNTLLAMNVNPKVVDDYLRRAGKITFAANRGRKLTALVTRKGLDAAFIVGNAVNDSLGKLKFNDTLGHVVSQSPVNCSGHYDAQFNPAEKMKKALAALTGMPVYQYRAFELLVTLDLDVYQATRRLIVPADLGFTGLHKVLQSVYCWKNHHLYDFAVLDEKTGQSVTRLVMNEADLPQEGGSVLITGHKLSDYLPEHRHLLYTYDFGDNWEHEIELVRVIEDYDKESPYLAEASGQAPPEDVGGVDGFVNFRKIMLDPTNPDYAETKEWAGYWSPKLYEWESRPRVVYGTGISLYPYC